MGWGFSWCTSVLGRPCSFRTLEVGLSQGSCNTLHGSQCLSGICEGPWWGRVPPFPWWWQTSAHVSVGSWAGWILCSLPRDRLLWPFTRCKLWWGGREWGFYCPSLRDRRILLHLLSSHPAVDLCPSLICFRLLLPRSGSGK